MEPKIIWQDDFLMVIDKPAGWIVNESQTTKGQQVLQDWLSKMDYPIAKDNEYRSGIVHRLDKETSGVLLVAKTKEVFGELQRQFKERKVQKTYVALVHGEVRPETGKIDAPVGRLPWRRDRFGVLAGGREATTGFKVLKIVGRGNEDFTLLELYPKTGRTHQIRIHLKYQGHPIVADDFYAGRKTARRDRVWCPRLFLHASKIEFVHPESGKAVEIESPLASDLRESIDLLH